jgi:hypothetical protein
MWSGECSLLFGKNVVPLSSGSYSTPKRNVILLKYYI